MEFVTSLQVVTGEGGIVPQLLAGVDQALLLNGDVLQVADQGLNLGGALAGKTHVFYVLGPNPNI